MKVQHFNRSSDIGFGLLILALLLMMIVAGVFGRASAATITAYSTGSDAELVASLPINGPKQVIFELPLFDTATGGLVVGDIVAVSAKAQVTDLDTRYEVMVSQQLWVCPAQAVTYDPTTNNPVGCFQVDHASATNCTVGQHHCYMPEDGLFVAKAAIPTPYLIYISRAAWDYHSSTTTVQVNNGNGQLQALKIRP